MRLRISARKSDLARLQAYQVGEALQKKIPGAEIQYNFRESLGDKNLTDPLWKMPEKGVFTEDFVQDLLDGKTDMVVHSWKDLPTAPRVGTKVVATLPRADQRDLLIFKKSHAERVRSSKALHIFSSSPRRAYNLENFFKEHLPFQLGQVQFHNVRGNIQTRVRKLLEDANVDGLILAKAAVDRLLTAKAAEFQETRQFLREALQGLDWVVLPLSVNPNAAAQGALAIEIKEGREDLEKVLAQVDCRDTFASAQRERETLASFGGGCHQKIGVAVLKRAYGEVFFLKGLTDQGQILDEKSLRREFSSQKLAPQKLASSKELKVSRSLSLSVEIPTHTQGLWVAKAEAYPQGLKFSGLVWTAGLQTWKKLAQEGVWVHGSSESLGEDENPQLDVLFGGSVRWAKLTHKDAPQEPGKDLLATYQVEISSKDWNIGEREAFYWNSGSQFLAALQKEPSLRHKRHACGPGNTYKILRDQLGPQASIEIYLDEEDWRKSCSL
ncbi:hydroxymethylbilane synthase [Bdellovibrio sp. HCB337]|uniref:hydroxymethylbilane synthase n=1 Tax=Bdellovibrio sp. HCB337 TaxID=3394358 RepID=UPI0039A43971